jgi:chromosomal replication initiator protein
MDKGDNMSAGLMKRILEELSREMPRTVVEAWFSDASVVSAEDQVLVLCSPVDHKRGVIESRYIPALKNAMQAIFEVPYEISLAAEHPPEMPAPEEEDAGAREPPAGGTGNGRQHFTFDRFVVGDSNRFAYSMAQVVSKSPGVTPHNPLFLHGGSGLGKTHLLYAILNRVREDRPDFRILCFSAEQFTNDLVAAIQSKNTAEFKERYRSADLILVDDIQFIAKVDFSQEEFFHTFNTLIDSGRQIVLTSDKPPRDLPKLMERLRTRFEEGGLVDIKPPDFETRMAIINSKAQSLGILLSPEVADYLAQTITSNVRQIEGAVKKLLAVHDLMGVPIDLDTAQEAVADMIRQNPGINPTPQLILNEVASFYKLEERKITGKGRQASLVNARQTAMYLIREMTNLSLEQIGEKVFSRDHSTVSYALQRVEERRKEDPDYDNDLKSIIENIRGV